MFSSRYVRWKAPSSALIPILPDGALPLPSPPPTISLRRTSPLAPTGSRQPISMPAAKSGSRPRCWSIGSVAPNLGQERPQTNTDNPRQDAILLPAPLRPKPKTAFGLPRLEVRESLLPLSGALRPTGRFVQLDQALE